MMKQAMFLAVFGATVCAGDATLTAGELNVGVVHMDRAIKAHPDAETAEALLEQQLAEFEQEKEELLQEREKLERAFEEARAEAENKALSEEARREKMIAARDKLAAVKRHEQKIREVLNARKQELTDRGARMRRRIVEKIRELLADYARKEGLAVIIDASARGVSGVPAVVFAAEGVDITESVVRLLAEQPAGEGEAEAGAAPAAEAEE